MKLASVAVAVALLAPVVLSNPVSERAYPWGGKRCKADKDCDKDEACISYYITSQCELKKGEGESCDPKKSGIKGFRFGSPPCQDGLECQTEPGKPRRGKCVKPKPENSEGAPGGEPSD
ncbi:hypothetical protein FRC12_009651 [Ceratobasidium sp. 428]|nr:hypothetical protein FRC12_009651 [Ceratobasidium sp. 428]